MKETFYQLNVPCRIALIADTHNHPVQGLISSLEKNKPDVICIAGDIIRGYLPKTGLKMEESKKALDLLKQCAAITTTYFSFGNHEWLLADEDVELIRETGVEILDNSWVSKKDGIVFGGLSSGSLTFYRHYREQQREEVLYPGEFPAPRAFVPMPDVSWIEEFERQEGYKVLLCHQPEYYTKYLKDSSIDLFLSGHAHGGQIRIGNKGLYAPDQGFFPKLISGVFDDRLVISRGLANTSRLPRFNNPTEIVYIEPRL